MNVKGKYICRFPESIQCYFHNFVEHLLIPVVVICIYGAKFWNPALEPSRQLKLIMLPFVYMQIHSTYAVRGTKKRPEPKFTKPLHLCPRYHIDCTE